MAVTLGVRIAGRFAITGPLGAGSMGEVYQAHDLKLQRDVAVKLLSPALASSDEHLRRFEREARAASALNHPNICTIYDIGQAEEAGNRPYLVMELLRGSTLFEMLGGGPLPIGTVINLGVQIADALDAAHQAGIVHRDLKPANIFITSRGDAKLLDFGLAAMMTVVASLDPVVLSARAAAYSRPAIDPLCTARRYAAASAALDGRRSRSFSSIRLSNRRRSAGMAPGPLASRPGGSSCRMPSTIAVVERPSNARRPVSIS